MSNKKTTGWKGKRKPRPLDAGELVGRGRELAAFERNLAMDPDDELRSLIFNIWGQGGVGKTYLLTHFRKLASQHGAVTAVVDEAQRDLLAVLARIAVQFAQQGYPLHQFDQHYATVQERQQRNLSPAPPRPAPPAPAPDSATPPPPAPLSPASDLETRICQTYTLIRRMEDNLHLADDAKRRARDQGDIEEQHTHLKSDLERYQRLCQDRGTPMSRDIRDIALVMGVDGVVPPPTPPQSSRAASHETRLLADAIQSRSAQSAYDLLNRSRDHAAQEGVDTLTRLLLRDLCRIAEQRMVALCFDTYEATSSYLDSWLRDLVAEEQYGELPLNGVLVIAGRHELDRHHWNPYEEYITRFNLEPFSEAEARDYLTSKGVTNEQVIATILHLSGRLPLLVATMAATTPDDPQQLEAPTDAAVERFLMWVDDPMRRQVALDAALPLHFNRDIIAVLAGEAHADALCSWLVRQPFVRERSDGWVYHEVVRTQMLRHQRRYSPREWATRHGILADYYQQQCDSLALDDEHCWSTSTWREHARHHLYHRLCQAPIAYLPTALNGFLAALKASRLYAQTWAETIEMAGAEGATTEVQEWGKRLSAGLTAYAENHYAEAVPMFTTLITTPGIEQPGQVVALVHRGISYREMKHYDEALCDLDLSIALDPNYARAFGIRGGIYAGMQRYNEALHDLEHALELDPNYAQALGSRGQVYRTLQRYEDALCDFEQALELDPNNAWALGSRGQVYRALQRYDDALSDLTHALELDSTLSWVISERGTTYHQMGCYEDALCDFDRALELDPQDLVALNNRGLTYQQLERFEEALQDFDRIITLDATCKWAIAQRGRTYHLMGCYEDALRDQDRAIAFDPKDAQLVGQRGLTYCLMKRYEDALHDLDRALELAPNDTPLVIIRGITYYLMKRYHEALRNLDQVIALDSNGDSSLYFLRSIIHLVAGDYKAALDDIEKPQELELDKDDSTFYYLRSLAHRFLGESEKASADLNTVIKMANEEYEQSHQDSGIGFVLALCYLTAEDNEQAMSIFQDCLSHASKLKTRISRYVLDWFFLALFPDHAEAQAMRALLTAALDAAAE